MQKIHNKNDLIILEKIQKIYDQNNIYITDNLIDDIDLVIKNNKNGQKKLIEILHTRLIINNKDTTILDGLIFRKLIDTKINYINLKLRDLFPNGIINSKFSSKIDYQTLQNLLIDRKFQEADKLTQTILCELTPLNKNNKRKWLYFTDIPLIPSNELLLIDLIWRVYSNGKFGFSIQKRIWENQNHDWDKFLNIVGWVKDGTMRRYPKEFKWNLNAPKGHLPLLNQLRGVQVINYIFKHIAWL